jgi:DNA segregation ATPase FtsK/SpoIIIE, S-DNA-T family
VSKTVAIPDPAEVDEHDEVIDAELVDDDATETARPVVVNLVAQVIVKPTVVIRAVVTHRHARTTGRHLGYIPLGAWVIATRLWNSRSSSRYDRMMRMAEATGNVEAIGDWEDRRSKFLRDRHQRRMDMIRTPIEVFKALPWIIGGTLGMMIVLGMFLAMGENNISGLIQPFIFTAWLVKWAVIIATVTWFPAAIMAGWIGLGMLWHAGRTAGNIGPGWMRTTVDPDVDIVIDETTIAQALEALRIPQVTNYLKDGMPLQFITPCRRDGRGTHAVIRLPAGVPAEKIGRRRGDFATGLYRQSKEIWPTTGSEAGILDLWIADKGALADGAGPYPLLHDGVTDVFKGVPFGRNLRGDEVIAPLMERNTLAGGMPGQGKSSAARAIMCGAALDPTAELVILIPDVNFDFTVMECRCSTYIMGAEGEQIEAIRDYLADLHDEVQRRGQLLVDHEEPAVTRKLASAGIGLHPKFVLLEEAHVAITHPTYGKEISGLLVAIVKLGRKRGIHMIVSTQAPTRDSMPRDVTRNCSNGIAFAVGDHVANDALLGQGAYAAGHRATELIPGTDRGTAVVKGFSGERSEVVQVYFLDVARDSDQVTPIIDRAMAEIERRGRTVPGKGGRRPPAIEMSRDLLDDLGQVAGDDRVKIRDAVGLLRKLAPAWSRYQRMTAKQLAADLKAAGVRTVNASGTLWLDPAELRRVLAERDQPGG